MFLLLFLKTVIGLLQSTRSTNLFQQQKKTFIHDEKYNRSDYFSNVSFVEVKDIIIDFTEKEGIT